MNNSHHAKGSIELGELKRPSFPLLSNNTNITAAKAVKEAQAFTTMNDPFVFLTNPVPPRQKTMYQGELFIPDLPKFTDTMKKLPLIDALKLSIEAIVGSSKQKRLDDINKALELVKQRKNAKKQKKYIVKEIGFQKKIKKGYQKIVRGADYVPTKDRWNRHFPIKGITHEEDKELVKKTRYLETIEYFDNDNYDKGKI